MEGTASPISSHVIINNHNKSKTPDDFKEHLMNWLSVSADSIVILILGLALALKFIFIEDKGDIAKQLEIKKKEESPDSQSFDESSSEMMHPASSLDISIRQRFGGALPNIHTSVFPLSGMGDSWIGIGGGESQLELEDKEVQTDAKAFSSDVTNEDTAEEREPRSVDECLAIYRSEVIINIKIKFIFELTIKTIIKLNLITVGCKCSHGSRSNSTRDPQVHPSLSIRKSSGQYGAWCRNSSSSSQYNWSFNE